MSMYLMKGLIVVYAILAIFCAFEKDYPRLLYWISSIGVTSAVVWGMK